MSEQIQHQSESSSINQELSGQVAIVTGGGRGIGRAIALELARAGMAVAVTARTGSQLDATVADIAAQGGSALAIPTDVVDAEGVQRMVKEVEQRLGPVDLLVNNAGLAGQFGAIWEVDAADWWRILEVNLRGPLLCAQAVLPGMVQRRRGRIINVASGAGTSAWAFHSAYAVSKTALIRLSENLAAELKQLEMPEIAVFALSPGLVRTAMTEVVFEQDLPENWDHGIRQALESGEHRPPEDAARLVRLLASGRADILSGCFIGVSDDIDALIARATEIEEQRLYTLQLPKLG